MKKLFQSGLAFLLALCLLLPATTGSAATNTIRVTPASTDWGFVNDNGVAGWTTGFENGPETPPLGIGSAFIELSSAGAGITLATAKYQETLLSSITALSYSTYTNLSPSAMSFQINYDPDITTVEASTWYGRLIYEPYVNGTVTNGTWQTWDTINGGNGKWWASGNANSTVDEACPQSAPCTLATLLAAFPKIGIRNDALSGIQFKAGSNWNGFAGNVDNLSVEIGGNTDIYDFDPFAPPVITEGTSVNVTMSENGSPTPFSLTLNATDLDADDTLTWSISTQATHGTASVTGTGLSKVIGYTPALNYNGTDSFVVQVSDGTATDTITVNVTIDAVDGSIATFLDVPVNHWAWAYVESIYGAGITAGCGNNNYCPTTPVTRDQMAIFLLRGIHGSSYTPPPMTGTVFADVPMGYWAGPWIEQLAAEGITAGCGNNNYCPTTPVTRDQMAVFLQRTFNLPLP